MSRSTRARASSQVSEDVLASAVVEAVDRLRKPVTPVLLSRELMGSFKRSARVLETLLECLADQGRLVRLPARSARKKPAYGTTSIRELAKPGVEAALAGPDAPLTLARLRSHRALKTVAEYLPDDILRAMLGDLAAQQAAHVHPRCSAAGKVRAKPSDLSYSAAPVNPRAFVAPALKAVTRHLASVAKELRVFGVSPESVEQAFLELVATEFGEPARSHRPAPAVPVSPTLADEASTAESIYQRMARVNPAVRDGAMVRIDRLRAACSDLAAEKRAFDAALVRLSLTDRVALHRHDDPAGLLREECEALVADNQGGYFNAVSWRL